MARFRRINAGRNEKFCGIIVKKALPFSHEVIPETGAGEGAALCSRRPGWFRAFFRPNNLRLVPVLEQFPRQTCSFEHYANCNFVVSVVA
jgi:hypothetical protein